MYIYRSFSAWMIYFYTFLVHLINWKIVVQVVIIISYWIAHLNTLLFFSDYLLLVAKYWWQWQIRPVLKTSDFLIYVQNYKLPSSTLPSLKTKKLEIQYHSWDFMSLSFDAEVMAALQVTCFFGEHLLSFSTHCCSSFSVCFSSLFQWWTDIILKLVFQCKYHRMVIRSPFIYLER